MSVPGFHAPSRNLRPVPIWLYGTVERVTDLNIADRKEKIKVFKQQLALLKKLVRQQGWYVMQIADYLSAWAAKAFASSAPARLDLLHSSPGLRPGLPSGAPFAGSTPGPGIIVEIYEALH